VRGTVTSALDAEIQTAGDEGNDETFNAFRALRVAVVQDLTARGATLAPIVTVMPPPATPALVLAQRFYRDSSRADQLVSEAGDVCDNPLFMPSPLQVLAS
jgi:prophage DNA circulation protein